MQLDNKRIVITGASGGIGRAIAVKLAEEGASLVLVARHEDRLCALRDELPGAQHVAVAADLTQAKGRGDLLHACRAAGVDVLINNAGVSAFGEFETEPAANLERLIATNLTSTMLVTQALLPLLRERTEAQIVNVGSTFGSIGHPGFAAYCASKFGLRGFSEALRRELADTKVRVSYLAPRATRTSLNSEPVVAMNARLGTAMDPPEIVADSIVAMLHGKSGSERYIGWPEKLFVRINALIPGLVDKSLGKRLPLIQHFARTQPDWRNPL